MRGIIMRSLTLGMMLIPVSAQAQRISAHVVVSGGRYHSDMVGTRPRIRYRRNGLDVVRWFPRRGMVVVERYQRFRPTVSPLWQSFGEGRRWLRRRGFRPVTVYVRGGHYYHRVWADGPTRGNPTFRPLVVWQRGGRVYRIQEPLFRRRSSRDHRR
jgi:hypothetical protein